MRPTPQQRWPLLDDACGAAVWVKHENQTPVGAFKVRGGLVYFDRLQRVGRCGERRRRRDARQPRPVDRLCRRATRHSRRDRRAARQQRRQERRDAGARRGADRRGARLPGVARSGRTGSPPRAAGTWCRRSTNGSSRASPRTRSSSFAPCPSLDTLYVPIGLGSGICGAIAARDALALPARIVAVVAASAPAYARSLALGRAGVARRDDARRRRHGVPHAGARGARDHPRRHRSRGRGDRRRDRGRDARDLRRHAQRRGRGGGLDAWRRCCRSASRRAAARSAIVLTGANVDAAIFARVLSPVAICRSRWHLRWPATFGASHWVGHAYDAPCANGLAVAFGVLVLAALGVYFGAGRVLGIRRGADADRAAAVGAARAARAHRIDQRRALPRHRRRSARRTDRRTGGAQARSRSRS